MIGIPIGGAAMVPVPADLITDTRSLAASLTIFAPRNVLAFAEVCLVLNDPSGVIYRLVPES